MIKDTIKCGETYVIPAEARDGEGNTLVMDNTWSAACRIISKKTKAIVLDQVSMPIANGKASISLDTGNAPWAPGIYLYDIRITDPDGNDSWSEQIQVTMEPTITSKSP